ncbi:Orexin receptor type 2 [Aphelenchoides bicaudatus]|nr:Orexin receptor type 2 [Aphelenchoides bicaudatus]
MEANETLPTVANDYEDDFLKNMSDADYIEFVAQFLKPTPIEFVFVGVYLCLMLIGIVGNCLVVYVVLRNKAMWSSLNYWLVNLAVSDLLILILCLPATTATDITKTFWFGTAACKSILFAQNTSVYVSVLTLMCVSIERWRAVTNPLAHQIWKTFQIIPCIWLIAFILSLPEPFTLQIYPAEYERKNLDTAWGSRCTESWGDTFQQKYQLTQTLILFFFPLLIISGLCIHMSLILRRKALQVGERQLRNRKRATRILISVTLLFGISYLPVHLHNIATAFHLEAPQDEPSLMIIAFRKFIPRLFSYSSSSFNPILYNFTCEKFRKEFRRAFCFGDKNQRKMSLAVRRSTRYSSVSGTNL